MSIKSFKCSETESLFKRQRIKRFTNIESVARRKLEQLDWASVLDDLRVPPGNRLEALKHDRARQHSIRINDHSACALCGQVRELKMSKLLITTSGVLS